MDIEAVIIPVHAVAASLVILLAPVQVLRRRKDRAHRYIGRSWVVAMYFTCVSGMFIYSLTGGFTIFHGLAIFTFGTTTLGVINARSGKVLAHRGNMTGGWIGALIAGGFAVLGPSRDIPKWAVGDPVLFWSIVAVIIAASTVWVWFVLMRFGRGRGHGSRGGSGSGRGRGRLVDREVLADLPSCGQSGRAGPMPEQLLP